KAAKPYPGWPFTFNQLDNYGREAVGYLPSLKINQPNQVVQVVEEKSGEVVYTLRIVGKDFRPKVFSKGTYTINVGEGSERKVIKNVQALPLATKKTIKVDL
ncbi:MAG TPA: hypothetical protein DEB48_03300, partial [Verrucomicrobiales bacterium]|nr:hypothetical protein [Verrucomicrobiales bacterium]